MIENLDSNLPAIEMLLAENIRIRESISPLSKSTKPLRIVLLNLMPIKQTTERDFIRILSNSPLPIELTLLNIKEHVSKNTPLDHIERFYKSFNEIENEIFDGLIVTGAPLEHLPFEEVTYWPQIVDIFNWARTNVNSTLYVCWAAQAALYHFYGVEKRVLTSKLFGIFDHTVNIPNHPIVTGFDDKFFAPHSRYTEVRHKDIESIKELKIVAESHKAGVYIIEGSKRKEIFVTGHSEYSALTLHDEYQRDLAKFIDIDIPYNYYPNNDTSKSPIVTWRSHANLLYGNWINYYVNK
ncbi:MAG: homoserine O-succinyltransferase [Bacteroidales bacterium]